MTGRAGRAAFGGLSGIYLYRFSIGDLLETTNKPALPALFLRRPSPCVNQLRSNRAATINQRHSCIRRKGLCSRRQLP